MFLPNGALRIHLVQREDGGMYECLAVSKAGSDSIFVTLTVQIPPTITSDPVSEVVAVKGDEALLPCEATGDPLPHIEWRKDQHEIDFFEFSHKYLMHETGSLIIPEVEEEDEARYMCIVNNPAGMVTREIGLVVQSKSYFVV
jgi:hypothetical protein